MVSPSSFCCRAVASTGTLGNCLYQPHIANIIYIRLKSHSYGIRMGFFIGSKGVVYISSGQMDADVRYPQNG